MAPPGNASVAARSGRLLEVRNGWVGNGWATSAGDGSAPIVLQSWQAVPIPARVQPGVLVPDGGRLAGQIQWQVRSAVLVPDGGRPAKQIPHQVRLVVAIAFRGRSAVPLPERGRLA